jgi:hypothetical protein
MMPSMSRHRFDHSVDRSDDAKDVSAPARPQRIEVITGVERRRKWSAQEKAAIVAESLAEGAVVSEVARRHGLNPQQGGAEFGEKPRHTCAEAEARFTRERLPTLKRRRIDDRGLPPASATGTRFRRSALVRAWPPHRGRGAGRLFWAHVLERSDKASNKQADGLSNRRHSRADGRNFTQEALSPERASKGVHLIAMPQAALKRTDDQVIWNIRYLHHDREVLRQPDHYRGKPTKCSRQRKNSRSQIEPKLHWRNPKRPHPGPSSTGDSLPGPSGTRHPAVAASLQLSP